MALPGGSASATANSSSQITVNWSVPTVYNGGAMSAVNVYINSVYHGQSTTIGSYSESVPAGSLVHWAVEAVYNNGGNYIVNSGDLQMPAPPPPSPPAPVLLSPSAGTVDLAYLQDQVFTWQASTAYGGQNFAYFLYRTGSSGGWTTVAINGSTQSYTLPAGTLLPNTQYQWTVQTRCTTYNSWSTIAAPRTFTTGGSVAPPTLITPNDGTVVKVTDSTDFAWQFNDPTTGVTQAQADFRYRNITDNSAWIEILDVATVDATYTLAANTFTPSKQYEWQVRTTNSNGVLGPYSASKTLNTVDVPTAPTAFTPSNLSSLRTSTPDLTATRVALPVWQPAKMEWEFATDAAFTQNVVTYQQTVSSIGASVADKLPVVDRLPQGTWYARIRQVDNLGQYSDYSATVSNFTISHAPSANSFAPTGAGYIVTSTASNFTWQFADTSETDKQTAFQIVVENNATGELVFDSGKVTSTVSKYTRDLTTAPQDTLLRWKIKVWDTDDVAGSYSDYQLFYTGDAPLIVVTPGDESIVDTNRPTIEWTLTLGGDRVQSYWSVSITDRITGQVVASSSDSDATTRSWQPAGAVLSNGLDYSIIVGVQDSAGLSSSFIANVHTQFDAPEEVVYTVDVDSVDSNGYVLVDWSREAPDSDFINFKVYRRDSSLSDWTLLATVTDATITHYDDWMVKSGTSYQWTVTQTVLRFGIEIESSLGYRASLLTTPRTNLSADPSADVGISGWTEYDGTGGTSEITRETTDSYLGSGFVRITYTVPPTSSRFGGLQQVFDVQAGLIYTASCYIRQNQAAMLHVAFLNGDTVVADQMQEQTLVTDEWVQVSISAIAPAGAVNMSFAVYASVDVTAGYQLDIDAVLIEQSDTVGDYFDGYTSGAHWNGTSGLSTSTLDKLIVPESGLSRVDISNYWILNYQDSSMNILIPNVTADDYTEEWEENTFTLIGRGRKKEYGTYLGRNGTLNSQVRGYDDIPKITRLQFAALKQLQATYYLRTPFGDLICVGLGNIALTHIAGTGLSEMFDLSIPYEELSTGSLEPASDIAKQPTRMQVIDNGDGTLTLVPVSDENFSVDENDIVEIDV